MQIDNRFKMANLLYHTVLTIGAALIVNSYHDVVGSRLNIEGEDMENVRDSMVLSRSSASDGRSVSMRRGDMIYFEFCLMSATNISIESLTYSNDGGTDHLEVSVDSHVVWNLQTMATGYSDAGSGWNNFVTATKQGGQLFIREGRHRLSIYVSEADSFGVEIDHIEFFSNSVQSIDSLKCSIFCFDDITYADDMSYQTTTPIKATAVQSSVNTSCAEEDNVNIPVFHRNISKFVVSASMPKYASFLNNRGADWTNCKMAGPFWIFQNVSIGRNVLNTTSNLADMTVHFTPSFALSENKFTVDILFDLKGPSTGFTDSEIGALFNLNGIRFNGDIRIDFQFFGRTKVWSPVQSKLFKRKSQNIVFQTTDYSFFEGKGNKVKLDFYIDRQSVGDIFIQEIFMSKRFLKPDSSKSLYNDGTTIIEGVDIDMWWRINETMSVTLTSNRNTTFNNVDYLRIYQKVPWTNGSYSQVFVLYQDGNVRLLPLTPHGLDWIPFGSSVLIGQSDPSSNRPCAPISHLDIDPQNLTIRIFYIDGSLTSLEIKTNIHETYLVILCSSYTRDLARYPFFTLRSMWVKDGNADVDHIIVDGVVTQHILGQWGSLQGNFFAFYRKCISQHNTLSPDIRLKVIS